MGNKNECNVNMHSQQQLQQMHPQACYQKPLHKWINSSTANSSSCCSSGGDVDANMKKLQQQQQHIERNKQTEFSRHVSDYTNFIDIVGCERVTKNGDISLISARSMPDLPKVCVL